jgi:pyrroline-5-carboxylate reductase
MPSLGVIGSGQFALYFITAMRKGGYVGEISLSPRNAEIAGRLARDHGCRVAASNQDVLEQSEIVLLSVRPKDASAAVAGLHWQPHHTALSAMAGISLDQHRQLLPGIGGVHLIMPASYIAAVPGPVPLYPPSEKLSTFLAHAGQVVSLETEQAYNACLFAVCFSTWVYDFADAVSDVFTRMGLSPAEARAITLGNIAGAAGYAQSRPDTPLPVISSEIATEGTYTKRGLDLLKSRGFDAPWREALALISA